MTSRYFLLIRSEPISVGAEHEQVERSALETEQLGAGRAQIAVMLDFRKHQLGGSKWGHEVSRPPLFRQSWVSSVAARQHLRRGRTRLAYLPKSSPREPQVQKDESSGELQAHQGAFCRLVSYVYSSQPERSAAFKSPAPSSDRPDRDLGPAEGPAMGRRASGPLLAESQCWRPRRWQDQHCQSHST